jgi:hypothetical protein
MKPFFIEVEFEPKDLVYLKTDPEQLQRIIVCMQISADHSVMYQLNLGATNSWHYAEEISYKKNIIKI